jgi:hypothetical protein
MGALFIERTGYPVFGAPESYSTTFPATEDPISEGGKWYNGGVDSALFGNVKTTTGKAFADRTITTGVNDYTDSLALLKRAACSLPRSFYVEVTISDSGSASTGSHEVEILACGYSNFSMYELLFQRGSTNMSFIHQNGSKPGYKVLDGTGGAPSPGGSGWGGGISDGEVIRAEFVRNDGTQQLTISTYKAGIAGPNIVIPYGNAYYLDGNLAGHGYYVDVANTPANYCISRWACGPL